MCCATKLQWYIHAHCTRVQMSTKQGKVEVEGREQRRRGKLCSFLTVNASQNSSLQKAMNLYTCRDLGTLSCTALLTFPVNNNNLIKTAFFESSQHICYNWCDLDSLSRSWVDFQNLSMKQACTSNFRYNCHYDVYI